MSASTPPSLQPPPLPSPVTEFLQRLHRQLAGVHDGAVASYIPELAKARPEAFGIAIATMDGQVYVVGDVHEPFTIQSVSKPLAYGVALEDVGLERVLATVGVEPSGEAFNSISLEPGTGRPLNPMINAGAIAVASLVQGPTPDARLARVVGALSAYAGRTLDIDEAVYASERDTGHRNRAIGHLLRNHDIIPGDPEPALDLYFRQCSVRVTCRDLALMAATLANGGVNPATGARAVAAEHVGRILSVMATCGIYDFSGEWVYRVGLPAKSGVGGGILAVLPGQLGIGVFSPRLDAKGNSVRGVKACEALSAELGLHFLAPPRVAAGAVRRCFTLAAVRSRRQRAPEQARWLDAHGARGRVYELQGDLRYATVEPLLRDLNAAPAPRALVLDFRHARSCDAAASTLLARVVDFVAAAGGRTLLARVRRDDDLCGLAARVSPPWARAFEFHAERDLALESAEHALLHEAGLARPARLAVPLAEHRLCTGASPDDLAELEACTSLVSWTAGEWVLRRGDAADALLLILRGELSVVLPLERGAYRRLVTRSAGMSIGESALLHGGRRTADVLADTDVEARRLDVPAFERLRAQRPELACRLLLNLLQVSAETTARLTDEVAALDSA